MRKIQNPFILKESHTPPPAYDREPTFEKMKQERDVMVEMRDGIHLCLDVYRPDAQGKFPALLAYAPHNKDLQTPETTEASGPQPAWSPFWLGAQEAGDSRFLTSRGYAHVSCQPRNFGKSDNDGKAWGLYGDPRDFYDVIEWIAGQKWCDGNVGMIGISAYAGAQWVAAMQQPPHLKAIFPYDAMRVYEFRDLCPGGVLNPFEYLISQLGIDHHTRGKPGELPPETERLWQEAIKDPDYLMYNHLYSVLTQKGQSSPGFFQFLIYPYDREEDVKEVDTYFDKINIPAYTGAGWYAYTYKQHLQGSQRWYSRINVPKKLLFTGPAHVDRPWHQFHHELLRWYDYWLKGIDTGVMDEPPVKMWVMGANEWYEADDWPVPETQWTKFYLQSWERLRAEPYKPSSRESIEEPDAFVQMPPTQTRKIQKLRYMTDPLPNDTLIAGPISLNLYASIDQTDTNWIVVLKDIGPDVSVRTARSEQMEIPEDLPERELTRGWLKASHRALDPERSKPYRPWHYFTKEAQKPVVPGEITEFNIEILSTANMFKAGHRICIEITCLDLPTGTAGFTNVEYIPYHICSSKTVLHKIYHSDRYPSHLLLPIIPLEKAG